MVSIFILYPEGSSILAFLLAPASLLALAGVVTWTGSSVESPRQIGDRIVGLTAGLACSFIWLFEIGFNNLVSPRVSTAAARSVVDNTSWALVALVMIVSAAVRAVRTGAIDSGVGVGFWSGISSGLAACLAGLLLVTAGMHYLLRDPLNVEEYTARASGADGPSLATYLAYQSFKGALLHLFVVGVGMGTILGCGGGAIGCLLAFLRDRIVRRRSTQGRAIR